MAGMYPKRSPDRMPSVALPDRQVSPEFDVAKVSWS